MDVNIQWYPGHMVKAKKLVVENLRLVDVVIEIVDARIPVSSRNPELDKIIGEKPRIIALNKSDLADPVLTKSWQAYFKNKGIKNVPINSTTGQGVEKLITLSKEAGQKQMQKLIAKGRNLRAVRIMILGIPNVGKSSLINRLSGRGTTKTGNRPGVTRGKQWIRVGKEMELLDTPGILWPKFDDPEVGFRLAVTGAIKEEVINIDQVVMKLLKYLIEYHPEELKSRYRLDTVEEENPIDVLKSIGGRRGLLISGGQVDLEKTAHVVLAEFRTGKIGKFTLDKPDEKNAD